MHLGMVECLVPFSVTVTLCNIAAVTIDRVQWEHWNSPKLGEHLVPTSDLIVPTSDLIVPT